MKQSICDFANQLMDRVIVKSKICDRLRSQGEMINVTIPKESFQNRITKYDALGTFVAIATFNF